MAQLFNFNTEYGILICQPCTYAIPPHALTQHLANKHPHLFSRKYLLPNPPARPLKAARALADDLRAKYAILDPRYTTITIPPASTEPIPGLKVYHGVQCNTCGLIITDPAAEAEKEKGKKKTAQGRMVTHCNTHRIVKRLPGGQPRHQVRLDEGPEFHEVYCQRFFTTFHQSSFFTVTIRQPSEGRDGNRVVVIAGQQQQQRQQRQQQKEPVQLLTELVQKELQKSYDQHRLSMEVYQDQATKTEISPWLEMTRWPRYFHGLKLDNVAPLAYAAHPATEPSLLLLTESIDRVTEQAYQSITQDKVSVFDQAKINSFISSDKSTREERLLMVRLSKPTFRAYKGLWKRLLCFTYRTSRPNQPIQLPHQFTPAQLVDLNHAILLADELLSVQQQQGDNNNDTGWGGRQRDEKEIIQDLDRACLLLCISLLDHTIKGDHFESVVLSFLAVLGINERPGEVFKGPISYSPELSKFIKIAQMFVVQRAVMAVEDGDIEYPLVMIDDMRERFMVRGTRSAFDWAYRLRAYAKKVLSNTTSEGYILWSEDGQTVTYKDASFTMDALKDFIAAQVREAQQQLEGLLLLHPDESREDVVPKLPLHRLQDNHANTQQGWNFLKDPRNEAVLEPGGESWIMNRVLGNRWLRDEWVMLTKNQSSLQWKKLAVRAYFSKLDGFLERLLLLVHVTSGQPARGTEILSLQYSNTPQGHHRSIFIEDGLISTVTSYHKGYNITGSAKVIHRYLPREVSELLVYYLWLVLPFWQQLIILAYKETHTASSSSAFLWPKGHAAWDSQRLTNMLQRETKVHLKVELGIMMYRHMAIAISRQHLKCGGFKRDYGVDKKLVDEQATHGTWFAGTIYARGLQEAPGHVKARKAEYRAVSREWHNFLGFRVGLGGGARKRPLAEVAF